MTAASLTRRPTVSVRLLSLTDRCTRGAAHGGPDRARNNSSGDGARGGSLLNCLTAGCGGQGADGDEEGDGGAFHDENPSNSGA